MGKVKGWGRKRGWRRWMKVKVVEGYCLLVCFDCFGMEVGLRMGEGLMKTDEERNEMVIQMRDECCLNSKKLDLDRVLRDVNDKVPQSGDFYRIGPFGVLPLENQVQKDNSDSHSLRVTSPPIEVQDDEVVVEEVVQASAPEMALSLSQFSWSCVDLSQPWDQTEPESSLTMGGLELAANNEIDNENMPSNWDISTISHSQNIFDPNPVANEFSASNGNILDEIFARDTGMMNGRNTVLFYGSLDTDMVQEILHCQCSQTQDFGMGHTQF
jgi:hypothetical protein